LGLVGSIPWTTIRNHTKARVAVKGKESTLLPQEKGLQLRAPKKFTGNLILYQIFQRETALAALKFMKCSLVFQGVKCNLVGSCIYLQNYI